MERRERQRVCDGSDTDECLGNRRGESQGRGIHSPALEVNRRVRKGVTVEGSKMGSVRDEDREDV